MGLAVSELAFEGRVFDDHFDQATKARCEFGDFDEAVVAQDLFVIELDDPAVSVPESLAQVEAYRVVVYVGSFGELEIAGGAQGVVEGG